MIRFLRTFAWLRWRLLLNGVRGARRRDGLEQVSRMLALMAPAVIVALSAGAIVFIAILGALGGHGLASTRFSADPVVLSLRALLAVATALVIVMPVGAAQKGGTTYTRLLLLPIPTRALHVVEVLAGLADPWILFMLPGLALFAGGLVVGGRLDAGVLVGLSALVFVGVLASLSALAGFLVSWLFRDRRRAELLTLLFMMLIAVTAILPQMFASQHRGNREPRASREPMTIASVDRALPTWTRALPSELFGRTVLAAHERRAVDAAVATGALAVEGLLCFWLSGVVYGRLLKSAGGASARRRSVRLKMPWRVPGFSEAASAVAWAQARTGLRSVRGRLAVLLPGPMLAILARVILRAPEESWTATLASSGHYLFGATFIFAIYAIQPFTMNQFASDRTGLTQQWLLPISDLDLVRGKALGGGVLLIVAALLAGLASALSLGVDVPMLWPVVALGGLATYVLITPATGLLSAMFPVPADMSRPGSGGNPHAASMFIGTFLVLMAAAPAVLVASPIFFPPEGSIGQLLVMTAWLVVATTMAWALLRLVARVVTSRRENLYLSIARM